MKKIILFIIVVLMGTILTACSNDSSEPTEYNLTIHFSLFENTYITKLGVGEYLSVENIDISGALKDDYFLIGWYEDENYTNLTKGFYINSDTDVYAKIGKYEKSNEISFFKNEMISNYFIEKGEKVSIDDAINNDLYLIMKYQALGYGDLFYRIKTERKWSQASIIEELLYFPNGNFFVISYAMHERKAIKELNLIYVYQYEGIIEFKLGDSVNNATFKGVFNQQTLNSKNLTYEAYYTVNINYNISKINLYDDELAEFKTSNYAAKIVDASNFSAAQKNFDSEAVAEECYGKLNGALRSFKKTIKNVNIDENIFEKSNIN